MKVNLIAMAVAAAMLSFGAVAQDKKQESQGAQGSSPATQERKPGMGASGSPSASGDKQSQRSAGAGGTSQSGSQSSETIKQVQAKLKEQGQDPGPADGIKGPKTQAALKEFQKDKGIKESGQLDRETLSALGVSGSASAGGSAAPGASDKPGEKKQ